MALTLEYTVEPFVQGAPGPHVKAALEAAKASGLDVDFGPFGTSVVGPDGEVLATLEAVVRRAFEAGATRVSVQLQRPRG
jgi:uncharacterized protein YqgV (UPF0045/DUF77 family)